METEDNYESLNDQLDLLNTALDEAENGKYQLTNILVFGMLDFIRSILLDASIQISKDLSSDGETVDMLVDKIDMMDISETTYDDEIIIKLSNIVKRIDAISKQSMPQDQYIISNITFTNKCIDKYREIITSFDERTDGDNYMEIMNLVNSMK